MKTSAAGRAAITRREGNKLRAYKDSVGIWTIGVGHTSAAGEPKVSKGMMISAAESDDILSRDLVTFEKAVNDAVTVEMTQTQFDALVSLAFNIGPGAFAKSSVVKRLNQGDVNGAANAFLRWNMAGGKVVQGLTNRRKQEREQFLWAPTRKPPRKPADAGSAVPAPPVSIEPKSVPAPVPVTDKELIQRVQTGLTLLNYNPGGADGVIGPLTAGAIRVFRADNGLPEGDHIDDELLTALTTAKPREMVPARANATASQVTTKVPEARHNWLSKITAGGLGSLAGLGVLIDGVLKNITDAKSYANEFTQYVGETVPGWAWCLIVLAIAAVIYWKSQQSENASVEAFKTGDRR